MVFHWPQITLAMLILLRLVVTAAKNGEPVDLKYNFSLSFTRALIWVFLLYLGGFFNGTSP